MNYRDKETREAVRWDGLYFSEQPEWLRRGIAAGSIEIVKDKVAIIDTAGGSIAFPGDYIIFGYGRIYTRHPEIFEKHFEKAE